MQYKIAQKISLCKITIRRILLKEFLRRVVTTKHFFEDEKIILYAKKSFISL